MRIRAFHIDGFGILSQVTVENLPLGMSVFLGHNEAGKSTCLEFFRTMLTGYPLPRSRDGKKSWSVAGQKQGGSLQLELQDGRFLRLIRQPGPGGGVLSLFDGNGTALEPSEYDLILGGVTREVYRNIYGFSLSELQTFESLDNDAVRNALYGAGFGLGLNSPGAVLSRMQSAMENVYKSRGKTQPLNAALRDWDEMRRNMRESEAEAARYDSLAAEFKEARSNLDVMLAEKLNLEDERRNVERRLGVWKQWEEWRLAQVRLARLDPVAESFPLDGISRLDRLLDKRDDARRQTVLVAERLERLDVALGSLESSPRLLPLAGTIKDLSERKSSCRNALIALPTLRANQQRSEDALIRQLSALGPGWDMERIRTMDRSLFVREELERQSQAMQGAESSIIALSATLERSNHDAEQARRAVETAKLTLEALPEPVADLEAGARDGLHIQMVRLEESRQRLPEREKSLASARAEYSRALSYLHLRPDTSSTLLHALADAQEQALILADEVRVHSDEAAAAGREAQAARKEEDAASERLLRIQSQERELSGADRKALDKKRSILRRLRQSGALLLQEDDRLQDLNERYAVQEAACPRPRANMPVLGLGILLVLSGVSVLIARMGFHLESINLAEYWAQWALGPETPAWLGTVQLFPWAGYSLLFVGVVFMTVGRPHPGPDKERNESQLEQLRSRRDTSAARLAELQTELRNLCASLGLDQCDPSMLDNLETQLDREREQIATNERLQQEKVLLQSELDIKRRQLQAREQENVTAENAVQTARRRWHDYLVRLGVMNVPLPEAASAYFARVEATRMARASASGIEEEIRELKGRGAELINVARKILPEQALPAWLKQDYLPEVLDEGSFSRDELELMVGAVKSALDSCRQAETLTEERARAAEALRSAEASAARYAEACIAAEKSLREAQSLRDTINQDWREYLKGLGLDLNLSPVTTREALDCMERCLNAEAECNRLREDIAMQERERDALSVPLAAMLDNLERSPHLSLDKSPDWLGTLDILQREVDKALREAEEERRLGAQRREVEEEHIVVRAAETDACKAVDELFALAQVADAESFRRLAAVLEEKNNLLRRCEDLEDALRLAAGDKELDSFLEEFASLEKGSLEARSTAVSRRLEQLRDEEQTKASELASLDSRLKDLADSDRLSLLRVEEARLEEEISRLSCEWNRYALARTLLVDARRRFEKERQPEVVKIASGIFSTITGGAWVQIAASLEDSSLLVIPAHGEPLAPELLSRGAQEQLYLALRLAHIRSQSRRGTALPVIMDDIMVNFDPERMGRTIDALADLTLPAEEDKGHQILFFTCHPFVAEKMLEKVPNSSLFHVESGKIAQA